MWLYLLCFYSSDEQLFRFECITAFNACVDHGVYEGTLTGVFMAVAAASGASSAAAFYQGVLLLVWLFQWILERVLLPGVSLYILLRFVNHLSREEMLGKMAELIETVISWGLRTLLGVAAGLQVVRGLVAPVMEFSERSAVGKLPVLFLGSGAR